MAVTEVYNTDNKKVGEVELNDNLFGLEVKKHILHDVVRCNWPTDGLVRQAPKPESKYAVAVQSLIVKREQAGPVLVRTALRFGVAVV